MDALDLVGTDDHVLEGGAVLELEDSVLVTALSLAGALDATTVGLHATLKRFVSAWTIIVKFL